MQRIHLEALIADVFHVILSILELLHPLKAAERQPTSGHWSFAPGRPPERAFNENLFHRKQRGTCCRFFTLMRISMPCPSLCQRVLSKQVPGNAC